MFYRPIAEDRAFLFFRGKTMSMGIGGWAYLTFENESIARFKYGSFDWNVPEHCNNEKICDGQITLHKDLLSALSDIGCLIKNGAIEITDCSNCWAKTAGEYEIDTIALALVCKILNEYKTGASFPEKCTMCK